MNWFYAKWQKYRKVLLPLGCALVLVSVVGSLVIAASTSSNTNTVVNQHNADLAQIKTLAIKISRLQQQRTSDLAIIKQEGKAIEGYAVELKGEINAFHSATYSVVVSLCQLTPGCVVPPP